MDNSRKLTVYYDGNCGFCQRSIRLVRALDWLGSFRYATLQSEEARRAGIPLDRNPSEMVLGRRTVSGDLLFGGWRAVKRILFRTPAFYVALVLALLLHPALPVLLLLGLTPLANPIGDRCYRWVARNRHRFPASTCSLENP